MVSLTIQYPIDEFNTYSRKSVMYCLLQFDHKKGSISPVSLAAMILAGSSPGVPQRFPAPSCCMPKL